MNIKGMHLSWIIVKDIKAAIKFYTEVVGLTLKEFHEEFKWAELSGPEGSFLGIGEENPQENVKAGSNAVVTIAVDNIEKVRKDFQNKNAKLVGDIMEIPGHVKMQTFLDADGNMFQLCEKLSQK